MPRPTAAQLAYGSATIVCSAIVMLLLSGTTTGVGAALVGVAALALGLIVAVILPLPGRGKTRPPRSQGASRAQGTSQGASPTGRNGTAEATAHLPGRGPSPAGSETRIGRPHSVRR
ncbi:hypothetical protein [Streptomyces corynorhini]|uniref:Uncharacterized protein n=1 Tax=Streptomyces corynorhini TaxID=2282652 RepID=A0A370B777_9ACTN|nr:hypothetical protein [Streptomyces corynorhini]RDG36512.1 hypothetical protein DVH02_19405 [Streptomyces corynorhini]